MIQFIPINLIIKLIYRIDMKRYKLFLRNYLCIFLLLPFLVGCEKYLKGEEKILGTATINGQNYKESIVWAWNFQGYPSCLEFYENYKLFYYEIIS